MTDAVVAGHLCLDIIPEIPAGAAASLQDVVAPGKLIEVGPAVVSTGGAVSNTGQALAKLGLRVRLLARLGDDLIGAMTQQIISGWGDSLGLDLHQAPGEASSYSIVLNPPGVDRSFLHCPGTNDTFGPEDVPAYLLDETRLFHLGYPPLMRRMYADGGRELATIMLEAKDRGATTSLDMAMPDPHGASGQADWQTLLDRVLPHVDIFIPSVEEMMYMLWRSRYLELRTQHPQGDLTDAVTAEDVDWLCGVAVDRGATIVGIKLGSRGLYLRTAPQMEDVGRGGPADLEAWQGRELWAPAFCVQVAGTVGAGDAAVAGFIAAMLRGESAETAVTAAVASGACNVEAPDATSGLLTWEETQARIAAGWERLDPHIDDVGWRWDEEAGLYRGPHDGT